MSTALAVPAEGLCDSISKRLWPHDLILGLAPLILCAQVFIAAASLPATIHGVADFRQLDAGGYMIRTGHAAELYNYEAQREFESKIAPLDGPFMLPINHLAFEELLFVPFSFFSYRTAYWLFFAFNCCLLVISSYLLRQRLEMLSRRWSWFPALLFAGFYPIGRTLVEGQDSILTLTLLAGAVYALDQGWEIVAGVLVGAGMYKFQTVIPIALLFFLWRRSRFCWGFVASSTATALVSLWIVGFHGIVEYAHMLADMSLRLTSSEMQIHYETFPFHMFNLRSLVLATVGRGLPHSGTLAIVLLSSLAVLWASARRSASMGLAITAASLVSYHFLVHDASILIIPIIAALSSGCVVLAATAGLLLVLPMVTSVVGSVGYIVAILILALFVLMIRSDASSVETALA